MKKIFITLGLLAAFFSVKLFAAIAVDTKFENNSASCTSGNISFVSNAGSVPGTVGSGTGRVMIAWYFQSDTAANTGTPAVTWNGNALTQIGTAVEIAATPANITMFGLKGDASVTTGNQTLAATTGGASGQGCALGAIVLNGADTTTGWQNNTTNTGTGINPTITITSTSGNIVVSGRIDNNSGTPRTVTTGTLQFDDGSGNGNFGAASNTSAGSSTAITWSIAASVAWGMIGVDVIAAGGGGGGATPQRLTLLGVGP